MPSGWWTTLCFYCSTYLTKRHGNEEQPENKHANRDSFHSPDRFTCWKRCELIFPGSLKECNAQLCINLLLHDFSTIMVNWWVRYLFFSTSYSLAWNTTGGSGSVSTLHLKDRCICVFKLILMTGSSHDCDSNSGSRVCEPSALP